MPHLDSSPEQLKDSARRLAEEVVNQGDVSAAAELIVPGHRDLAHGAHGVTGLAHRRRMLRRAFPDFHVIVEEQIAEGVWVAQRVSARGTHEGEFLGLAPSGQTAAFDLIELYRAGPAESQSYLVDEGGDVLLAATLGTLSVFFFIWFLGTVRAFVQHAEGAPGTLGTVAYGAGLVTITLATTATLPGVALAWNDTAALADPACCEQSGI